MVEKKMIKGVVRGLSLMLLLLAANIDAAQFFYRYLNADTVVVIDDHVPPEFVHQGYDVLSTDGALIKTVAPFNPAELSSEKEVAAKNAQRRQDLLMLRSFSTLEDLRHNRDRKLSALQRELIGIRTTVKDYKALLQSQEKMAANRQRSGYAVSKALSEHIARLVQQLEDAQIMQVLRTEELEEMTTFYARREVRFKTLKGLSDSGGTGTKSASSE